MWALWPKARPCAGLGFVSRFFISNVVLSEIRVSKCPNLPSFSLPSSPSLGVSLQHRLRVVCARPLQYCVGGTSAVGPLPELVCVGHMLELCRRAFIAVAAAAAPPVPLASLPPPLAVIPYGTSPDQVGDLYLPQDTESSVPVVALIHGGFWQYPYKRDLMCNCAADLLQSGVAVLNLEYRRCGGGGGFPETLADVAAGLDILADESLLKKYRLDGTRVAVVGHSAGAQLALWAAQRGAMPRLAGGLGGNDELSPTGAIEAERLAATVSAVKSSAGVLRPRCVVSAGGVLDLSFASTFSREAQGRAVSTFLGSDAAPNTTAARIALVSPIDLLPPAATSQRRLSTRWRDVDARTVGLGDWDGEGGLGDTTLGLVHGLRDRIVPPEHSTRMCVAAAVAGIGCSLHQIRREGHFEVLEPSSASWRAVRSELERGGVLPREVSSSGDAAKQDLSGGTAEEAAWLPAVPGSVMARTQRIETADELVITTRRARELSSSSKGEPKAPYTGSTGGATDRGRRVSSSPQMCIPEESNAKEREAEGRRGAPREPSALSSVLAAAAHVGSTALSLAWRAAAAAHGIVPSISPPSLLPCHSLQRLEERGFVVVRGYLPEAFATAVRADSRALEFAARGAGVGTKDARRKDGAVRRCRLLALRPPPALIEGDMGARLALTRLMDQLCIELNTHTHSKKAATDDSLPWLDARATELYYSYYSAGGHYVRHRDVPQDSVSDGGWSGDSRRVVSVLLYLDEEWEREWGGALRIFEDSREAGHLDVRPESGTLVLMRSDRIEHEVMKTLRPRHGIVGWLRTTRGATPAPRTAGKDAKLRHSPLAMMSTEPVPEDAAAAGEGEPQAAPAEESTIDVDEFRRWRDLKLGTGSARPSGGAGGAPNPCFMGTPRPGLCRGGPVGGPGQRPLARKFGTRRRAGIRW